MSTDSVLRSFHDFPDIRQEIAGGNILLLVHGYNNEHNEVYDAYAVIERKVGALVKDTYTHVLGYSWPGGNWFWEWPMAKRRANAVARPFRFLLQGLSQYAETIDLMSHSLGARVILKGLKGATPVDGNPLVRNYFCIAASVDDEVFESGQEFHDSIPKINSIFVFHSKRDRTLRHGYAIAEDDQALGLSGPEDKVYIEHQTRNIYVVNCKKKIHRHGDYKYSEDLYGYIDSALKAQPARFHTL